MKICSACRTPLPLSSFFKDKQRKDGHSYRCKQCLGEAGARSYRKHRARRLERHKEYASTPEARQKRRRRANLPENKKKKSEAAAKSRLNLDFRARDLATKAAYRARPEIKLKNNQRDKRRKQADPEYRLSQLLRDRLRKALKSGYKSGSAVRDLGCSIAEFRSYLESKFEVGMSWTNHGSGPGKWNIDHIVPLSKFDLTSRQHVVLACHYRNLQPLWFEDNIKKYNKYPSEVLCAETVR